MGAVRVEVRGVGVEVEVRGVGVEVGGVGVSNVRSLGRGREAGLGRVRLPG
jgi:hypothetical protein